MPVRFISCWFLYYSLNRRVELGNYGLALFIIQVALLQGYLSLFIVLLRVVDLGGARSIHESTSFLYNSLYSVNVRNKVWL
jgi:hypothetical protein